MQTQSDRLNEDVLRLNDECKLRARALIVSLRRINVDINIALVVTSLNEIDLSIIAICIGGLSAIFCTM